MEEVPSRSGPGEAQLIRLLDASRDIVFHYELRPVPGFTYVSHACTAITGYTPEEHYADPNLLQKLIDPRDRALLDEIAAGRRFADGTPYLLRWRRKDGTLIWTEQRIHVERDASGALVAFRGVVRDATRRVADEHQLREALAEQARLVEELRATLDRADPGTTFLPICSYCKSVRDDDGQWLRIEAFLEETMQAELTHGICTECYREHFPHDPVD